MTVVARRRAPARLIRLDRMLEAVPVFRLSDSAEDGALSFAADDNSRWRVMPAPDERLPGTFDQDVYVELMHRFYEGGSPPDGVVTFTLHAFLRSMGRRVDGRTYEQLRSALTRLERTAIEFTPADGEDTRRFSILSATAVERRRLSERDQLQLFPAVAVPDPGVARVALSPFIREHLELRQSVTLSMTSYLALQSPVARRLYRLIELARSENMVTWRASFDRLREQLPLIQKFPSHLQRVLAPAHEMLKAAGILREAAFRQQHREWIVDYMIAPRTARRADQ
ncbi:MAG TPA: replication initiator protein A [Gemmatimonadaceae bacterium]|jgi:plasmid replication initiation protein